MKKRYVFAVVIACVLAVGSAFAQPAAPPDVVAADDLDSVPGPVPDIVKDAPAAPAPAVSADDPGGLLAAIGKAASSKRWGLVTVLALLMLGGLLRLLAGKTERLAFMRKRWPSWALNFSLALLAIVGGGMMGGTAFGWPLLQAAILTALAAAGGLELFKDGKEKAGG